MAKQKELTLRLMIVDDSGEHAEAIVTNLRNGGIAVRPSRPQSMDEVDEMLSGQIDLLLAAHSRDIPLHGLRERIVERGKDIPLIFVTDTFDEEDWINSLRAGVRAIALRHRPEHLLHVVRMEVGSLHDRRNLRRLDAQMRETDRRCDALIASSRDPIAYIHEGLLIRANDAFLEMFGFKEPEDIDGMSLLDLVASSHVDRFKQLLKSLSRGESPPPQYELDATSMSGDTFPATMEFAAAIYEGEPCIQVVFRRREEMDPELAREVAALRQRDPVTGLLNRPAFIVALEDAVARAGRSEGQFGLLLIEPDHYTRILSAIGLDSADTLIAVLARHLEAQIDIDASIARFGDTSLAVLAESAYAQTHALADRIRQAFTEHVFVIGSRSATVTLSVGGVQIGEQIASVGQVLTRAFEMTRSAGELGGNTVSIFDPAATERVAEERVQRWIEQLSHALDHDEFTLHYQPVTSLLGEPLEIYQTFLRLRHDNELISPTAFLEIAEERDLIAQIDRWVVTRAIAQLGERQRNGRNTHLMVRIGPASLADAKLMQVISQQLKAEQVPGERLWLQIPEAKIFTHLHAAQECAKTLAQQGCRLGLEQFGSGLDSFQLLTHFKPAFIKLDRQLTSDIAVSKDSQQKTHHIIERARTEGMVTFAEFVSDAASMSAFFNAGVDYVQGQFIAAIAPEMN